MTPSPYQFMPVDEFFTGIQQWEALTAATAHTYDQSSRTVTVTFTLSDGPLCALLLTVIQRDTFRVRFNPGFRSSGDYSPQNSRSIVMNTLDELTEILIRTEPFTLNAQENADSITLATSASDNSSFMKMVGDLPAIRHRRIRFLCRGGLQDMADDDAGDLVHRQRS